MSIFNIGRKGKKIYSLGEAIKLLQTKKYENFTTIPVENGYRLVPMQPKVIQKENISVTETRRENFLNEIEENVDKDKFNEVPNYNNYKSAKNYNANQGIVR